MEGAVGQKNVCLTKNTHTHHDTTVFIFRVLGPIGLVTMLVARAFGASRVVIADMHPDRLKFAKGLGEGSGVETVALSYKDEVRS